MSKAINENSPLEKLIQLLLNKEKLFNFNFDFMTNILMEMWMQPQNPLRKSLIDYIIIAAINQKDFKGLKRRHYIDLAYILVTPKIKRASQEIIKNNLGNKGLDSYL